MVDLLLAAGAGYSGLLHRLDQQQTRDVVEWVVEERGVVALDDDRRPPGARLLRAPERRDHAVARIDLAGRALDLRVRDRARHSGARVGIGLPAPQALVRLVRDPRAHHLAEAALAARDRAAHAHQASGHPAAAPELHGARVVGRDEHVARVAALAARLEG